MPGKFSKASNINLCIIIIIKYYISAFPNTKSDHTLAIRHNNFTQWDAVLRHAQQFVSFCQEENLPLRMANETLYTKTPLDDKQ